MASIDTVTKARGMAPGAPANRPPPRVIRHDGGPCDLDAVQSGPFAPILAVWRQRQLFRRMVYREIEQNFRGSALGKAWAIIGPLFMLSLYTVAFGFVIRPHWQSSVASPSEVALIYFSGLIVFSFFVDCLTRAPTLMFEHITYIKKMVFPLEILAWVVVGGAIFRLTVGLAILATFYLATQGLPPPAVLAIPFLLALLSLFAVGMIWLLSAVAVYLRDIRHMIIVLMPAFMFLTPIFYPLSSVPATAKPFFYSNPLTFIIEGVRQALFSGLWPNWLGFVGYMLAAFLFNWLAYTAFTKLRAGFADVL